MPDTPEVKRALRVIADETPPLSREELQTVGNRLIREARTAALEAMHISTGINLFEYQRYTPKECRHLHSLAKDAVSAWMKVEAALSEIIREYDKARGNL